MIKILLVLVFLSPVVIAETTWIPISNGGNFIIIPFIPPEKFEQPKNININKLSNGFTVTWDDIEHASKYLIEGYDSNGNWIYISEAYLNSITLSPIPNGVSHIRVVACTYNSCSNSGYWSQSKSLMRQVIYIHTDLLGSPVAETKGKE